MITSGDGWVLETLYGLVGLLVAMVSYLWKKLTDDQEALEMRVRSIENEVIGEDKVKEMIGELVNPIKETQIEMRADDRENRQDIKEILRLMLERGSNE